MKIVQNIFIIAIFFTIHMIQAKARITGAQPVTPVKPAPQPAPAPAPAPKKQVVAKTFNDYMTEIRTQWKPNDVINAQGLFTNKFENFVKSADLDSVLKRTLLEAGKSLYLPLSANKDDNKGSISSANMMIQTIMKSQSKFYNPNTKLFDQGFLDKFIQDFNPDPAALDALRDTLLSLLSDQWQSVGEKDTAKLIPQARAQINASLAKYGFTPAQPALPGVPVVVPKPVVVQPIPQPKPAARPGAQQPPITLKELKQDIKQTIDGYFTFTAIRELYKEEFDKKNSAGISELLQSVLDDEMYTLLEKPLKQMLVDGKNNEYQDFLNFMSNTLFDNLEALNKQSNARIDVGAIVVNCMALFRTKVESVVKPAQPQPYPVAPAAQSAAQPSAGESQVKIGNTQITIVKGGIRQNVDAIVTPANEDLDLQRGGGIAHLISMAAGPELQEYCNKMSPQAGGKKCPTGQAVITPAFNLEREGIKKIIHAVAPFVNDPDREQLLASAYKNSLQVALDNQLKSVAFPPIRTPMFGYAIDQATPIAFATVRDFVKKHPNAFNEIRFFLAHDEDLNVYKKFMDILRK